MLKIILALAVSFGIATTSAFAKAKPTATTPFTPPATPPVVDLHAHLFMGEAMGLDWLGTFTSPIEARSWGSRFSSKVNTEFLERSGTSIVVASFYAHPLFRGTQRDSLRRQIEAAKNFLRTHPDWTQARSADEAKKGLQSGKRVMVFSIEGAEDVIETDEDIHEFIDEDGVRIVTPIHFTDGNYGGAAFMPGIEIMANPIAAFKSFFFAKRDSSGVRLNPLGLKEAGTQLAEKLIQHGVWIDLSHTSDASSADLVSLMKIAGQPLLYTHAMIRSHFRAERAMSPERITETKNSDGIIGLLPSDDMLGDNEVPAQFCPPECDGHCNGGAANFVAQYAELSQQGFPPGSIMIGTDIDAPLTFLRPSCEAAAKLNPLGFWNYGQLKDLWTLLRDHHLLGDHPETAMIDRFLAAWSRVKSRQ